MFLCYLDNIVCNDKGSGDVVDEKCMTRDA